MAGVVEAQRDRTQSHDPCNPHTPPVWMVMVMVVVMVQARWVGIRRVEDSCHILDADGADGADADEEVVDEEVLVDLTNTEPDWGRVVVGGPGTTRTRVGSHRCPTCE